MTFSPPPRGASPRTVRRTAALALALALGGMGLAGCASRPDRAVAVSPIPVDDRQRHPIVLADAPRSLDVFIVASAGLDRRQRQDLQAFAAEFRAEGRGRIRALVPRGAVPGRAVDDTLLAVRRGLAAAGVTGAIEVGSYAVDDPKLAPVLRLSFLTLQAGGAHPCGDWPEDLGAGSPDFDLSNRPYYNLGCANRTTLAAQVDDPRDLVRPRAEEPGDVYMRVRPIKDIRGDIGAPTPQGQDPSTNWTQSNLVPIGGR